MHSLLRRQLRRYLGSEEPPGELKELLAAIDGAYSESDSDREMVERSLELASDELLERNALLKQDVETRRRTEQQLTETLSVLASTLDSTADGILVVSTLAGRKISSFNRRFLDMWNIPREVAETNDDDALISFVLEQLSDPEAFLATTAEVYQDLESRSFDSLKFRDGRVFERTSLPQLIGGKPVGRVWSFSDVSERTQAALALQQSEEKFSKAFYRSPLAITITAPDDTLVEVNEAFSKLTGYDRAYCIGRSSSDLGLWVSAEDRAAARQMIGEMGYTRELQTQFRMRDGTILDGLLTAEVIELDGANCVLSLIQDVTARVRAEKTIRASEERFRALIENGSDIILVVSAKGAIEYASPSMESVMGYRPEDLIGDNAFDLVHPDDLALANESVGQTLRGDREPGPTELRVRHKDGSWRVLESMGGRFTGSSGAVSIVINAREVTQRKQAEETIRRLAYHDSLTTLPNRTLLEDRLAVALAQAQRTGQMLSLIFVDLDDFKLVNDTLGHSVGDDLLRAAADRLKTLVRDGDTVARVGGDEFVLLLNDVGDVDYAVEVARRIGQSLKEPYHIAHLELTVTASSGISIYPTDGEDATALLRNADTAMYRAKELGPDNFQLYTSGMGEQVRRRLTLETELRRGIDHGQLLLHYQPIVDIRTGEIASCEALVRWQHPERGLVQPMEFIGVAEKAGLITALSEWVMRAACLQHKTWESAGLRTVPIAVNISSHRFQYTGFGDMTRRILSETSLDPHHLRLEITEGVLMEDVDRAAVVLKGLRDQGIHISIDDFGTGYSSLSYLRHLPIDDLKIDRSFVSGITGNQEDQAIVRAIIALAESLHLNVIAEGVETDDQLQFLRLEGCQQAQGFLFARPMPAADFARLLSARKALVPGGVPG